MSRIGPKREPKRKETVSFLEGNRTVGRRRSRLNCKLKQHVRRRSRS